MSETCCLDSVVLFLSQLQDKLRMAPAKMAEKDKALARALSNYKEEVLKWGSRLQGAEAAEAEQQAASAAALEAVGQEGAKGEAEGQGLWKGNLSTATSA